MGMYTGLRMRGRLYEYAVPAVALLYQPDQYGGRVRNNPWDSVFNAYPELVSSRFSLMARRDFIPFGAISMQWDDAHPDWVPPCFGSSWSFQCSLKNQEGVIEVFLADVAPLLFEAVDHCEVLYCENTISALYALENGELVMKRPQSQGNPNCLSWTTEEQLLLGYKTPWMQTKQKV